MHAWKAVTGHMQRDRRAALTSFMPVGLWAVKQRRNYTRGRTDAAGQPVKGNRSYTTAECV